MWREIQHAEIQDKTAEGESGHLRPATWCLGVLNQLNILQNSMTEPCWHLAYLYPTKVNKKAGQC